MIHREDDQGREKEGEVEAGAGPWGTVAEGTMERGDSAGM